MERCSKCRRKKEARAQTKEERGDERIRECDGKGLKVPDGILQLHPVLKNVFRKIGNLFHGKNDEYEGVEEDARPTPASKRRTSGKPKMEAKPTKPVREVESDDEVTTLIEEMVTSDEDIFDEEFGFGPSKMVKGKKTTSPRDSQVGSEQ